MDKLYAIKIRQSDGTYGAAIPVSVLAENVDWNSTLSLVDILGQVDTSTSIQDQINNLKNTRATQASVNALDQKVDNAVEYMIHNSLIADAREGADGTEYDSLKERLDTEYDKLLSNIDSAISAESSARQSAISAESSARQSAISLLLGDIVALQTDVDTISSRVGSSSQKSIVFIGDSYTYGNGISDSTKIFPHLVASKLGVTNRNFAVGGTGFIYGDSTNVDFLSQLQNAVDDTTFDNNDVSYVVISGGRNDATQYGTTGKSYSEIYYALDDILTLAETSFPNARIFLIPMLFDANILPIDGYYWYLNLLKAALGGGHKCKVVKNAYSWLCGKFGLIQSDNIHPGVEGHKLLSSCILDVINGGDGFLNYDRLIIVVNNSKLTGSIGLSNDKDSYWFYGTITVTTALARGEGMAGQSLSAYNNIPCYMGNQKFFMTAVRTDNNNNGVYPVDLEFNITNKTILLRSLAEIPVGSYAITYQAPFGRYQNAATG